MRHRLRCSTSVSAPTVKMVPTRRPSLPSRAISMATSVTAARVSTDAPVESRSIWSSTPCRGVAVLASGGRGLYKAVCSAGFPEARDCRVDRFDGWQLMVLWMVGRWLLRTVRLPQELPTLVDHLGVLIRWGVELGRQVFLGRVADGGFAVAGGVDGGIDTGVDDAATERAVQGSRGGWCHQLERRHRRPKCVDDLC